MRLESRFSSSDNLDSNKQLRTVEDDDPDFVLLARARTAEVLRQRKLKKQRLKLAAEKFNEKPLKNEWIRFSVELGLIQQASSMSEAILAKKNDSDPLPLVDSNSVAKFLKITPGLGKTQIGEFLSKGPPDMYPFNAEVLKAYVDTFEFKEKNSHFDKALRLFLGHFRLPGEAQCIDRLMEAFANKLFDNLGPGKPFASADAAFILSFSTIMLNTDLHNPQIPHNKRMTKEEFLRNNRGINDGQDLPREYLEFLYDEIKTRQIQVDMSINDTENSTDMTADFTDMATWNKLLRKSAADQAPAAFTPTVAARKVGQSLYMSANEKDMFLVMANPYLRMLLTISLVGS
jgi:brefeldin A-resistance guanine nucleotide exchange factor 1